LVPGGGIIDGIIITPGGIAIPCEIAIGTIMFVPGCIIITVPFVAAPAAFGI
jgi:hypothetical protein